MLNVAELKSESAALRELWGELYSLMLADVDSATSLELRYLKKIEVDICAVPESIKSEILYESPDATTVKVWAYSRGGERYITFSPEKGSAELLRIIRVRVNNEKP